MFFRKGSSVLIHVFDSSLSRDANSTVSRLKWGTAIILPMNLWGSWRTYLQSQSELYHVSRWYYTLVINLTGQLCRDGFGRLSVKPWCYSGLRSPGRSNSTYFWDLHYIHILSGFCKFIVNYRDPLLDLRFTEHENNVDIFFWEIYSLSESQDAMLFRSGFLWKRPSLKMVSVFCSGTNRPLASWCAHDRRAC